MRETSGRDAAARRGGGPPRAGAAAGDSSRGNWRLWPWLLGVTVPLYALDQVTKFWVVGRFPAPWVAAPREDRVIPVVDGFFNLVRVHNTGVAFGMGNGSGWAPIAFMIVPLVALALIAVGLRRRFFPGRTGMLAVALLLTGIFGNFTDRLVQGSRLEEMAGMPLWDRLKAGYVVDFLDCYVSFGGSEHHWPSFNVADSCICVAAVLLVISGWRAESAAKAGK